MTIPLDKNQINNLKQISELNVEMGDWVFTPVFNSGEENRNHRKKPGSPGDILEHYGVKGMRWGVRKEDKPIGRDSGRKLTSTPKTADRELSDKNQRRVDKFLKRSDVMGAKVAELKLKDERLQGTRDPIELIVRSANKQDIKTFEKARIQALHDAEAVKQGKLTSQQKKVIIGAVAVTGVLAVGVGAVAISRGTQSGALNSYILRGGAFLRGQPVPFNVDKNLSGHMSASDLLNKVAKPVNPLYSTPGGQMNCRRSTYTYELRRRGYDVRATTSAVGWGQSESGVINALTTDGKDFFRQMSMSRSVVDTGFSSVARGDTRVSPVKKILVDGLMGKGVPREEWVQAIREHGHVPAAMEKAMANKGRSSSAKVLAELAKQPNGARGEVVFKFPKFGHSMAYEIVDGVPHIFDSQKGTLYNAATKMVESKWDGFDSAEITRLDNVDLDINFLTRWATNAQNVPLRTRVENRFETARLANEYGGF